MTQIRSAALAVALLAQPLQADTTPEAVWQLIQDSAGPALSAQDSRRGDALVLSHPRVALPDGLVLTLPSFTLRQQADGSVTLELPPHFPLVLQGIRGTDAPESITVTIAAPDMEAVFRDIGIAAMDVALSAESVSAVVEPITSPSGKNLGNSIFAALTLDDLSFAWQSHFSRDQGADAKGAGAKAHLSLGNVNLDLRAVIPIEGIEGQLALDLSALALQLEGVVPPGGMALLDQVDDSGEIALPEMLAFLDQGMRLTLGSTAGPAKLSINLPKMPEGSLAADLSLAAADALLQLDRRGALYDIGAEKTAFSFKGQLPDVPLDNLSLAIADMRETMRLDLPTASVKAPDWALLYKFAGIEISDNIWDLFDPASRLPRDPLSLVLDSAGTWTPDPRLMAGRWTPGPNELPITALSVILNEALVEGAGLHFSGTGTVDFDFADRSRYFNDMPVPEGALSFLTTGANALIDNLAALGLIGPEEVTSARFALMFIGKGVADKPDQLTTQLEFKSGSISLNGQKIR